MRRIRIDITREDIANAVCGNRARCVIANAMKRQLTLNSHGYVNVDGAGAAYSANGLRHIFKMPKTAVHYLREFDHLGQTQGQNVARQAMEPRSFIFKEVEIHSTEPPATRDRKNQINEARRLAEEARKLDGLPRKRYQRWAGV